MQSSSSTLSSLESFFGSLTAEITSKTSKLMRASTSEAEPDSVAGSDSSLLRDMEEVTKTVEEAEDILEQMELEIRGMPEADRQKCLNRWLSYKAELKRQVEQFHRTRKEVQEANKRRHLLGPQQQQLTSADDELHSGIFVDIKQKLLDNTETVERSGRKLNQGQQLLAETESVGAVVLEDLALQRETITRSRNRVSNETVDAIAASRKYEFCYKLHDTQEDLQTSSRVLSKMTNRILQSKLVLAFVALVIIAVIAYGIYRIIF